MSCCCCFYGCVFPKAWNPRRICGTKIKQEWPFHPTAFPIVDSGLTGLLVLAWQGILWPFFAYPTHCSLGRFSCYLFFNECIFASHPHGFLPPVSLCSTVAAGALRSDFCFSPIWCKRYHFNMKNNKNMNRPKFFCTSSQLSVLLCLLIPGVFPCL